MFTSLELYRRMVSVRMRGQMQYRLAFLLDALSTLIQNAVSFLTIALVLEKFNNIAGWTLGEVAFLYGTVEASFGLTEMIFSGFDPQTFASQVRLGALDQMMLRPVELTLQVLGSEFVLRRAGRSLQGFAVLALALTIAPIHWTFVKALYLPVVLVSLVAFFGGLYVIGATLCFWTVDSLEAINIFTYGGTEMMAYPMTIYQDWMRRFFTFILPAIFLNFYPSLYFLDKPDPLGFPPFAPFLSPVAGFGVLAAALAFWKYGIRHYQSTGT